MLRRQAPPILQHEGKTRLSPQQKDLWTFEELYPGSALNLCGAYWFTADPDIEALRETIATLSDRNALLRFRFFHDGEDVWQQPAPELIEIDHKEDVAALEQAKFLIEQFAARPFDLSAEPPMRALMLSGEGTGSGVLILAFHHIVTDWWSFDLLHGELSRIYDAITQKLPVPTHDLTDYRDFAEWWSTLETLDVWGEDLQYWKEQLRELPELPFGAHALNPTADRIDVRLAPDIRHLIQDAAQRMKESSSTVSLACFGAFLERVTGCTDIVIGTPSANRDLPGAARMLGYSMNMVPVRLKMQDGRTSAESIHHVGNTYRDALMRGRVPLGKITQHVAPRRQAGQAPLYQVAFMYLPEQKSELELPAGAHFERIHTGAEENEFVAILRENGEHLDLTFEFRSSAVSTESAVRWVAELEDVIRGMLTKVNSTSSTANSEVNSVVAKETGPKITWDSSTLPEIMSRQNPDAYAVIDGDVRMTFGELQNKAEAIASGLAQRGVMPGSIVGLNMERSHKALIALLGILNAGAAYLPLDPVLPDKRRQLMIEDSGAQLVICDGSGDDGTLFCSFHSLLSSNDSGLKVSVSPDDAAYVMYTSGSTGRPKGVAISHHSAANLGQSQAKIFGLTSKDVCLQFATLSFDASVEEIWSCWSAGACLVVGTGLIHSTLSDVSSLIRSEKISVLNLPTAMWDLLARSEKVYFGEQLRLVVVGGESFSNRGLREWEERHPGIRLLNTYGPTECTVSTTWCELTSADAYKHGQIIGEPLPNVNVFVVGENNELVHRGQVGELMIGGVGVAPGYIGAVSETRSFSTQFNQWTYRTGDQVRMLEDGRVVFQKRVDNQVKIRGFRVELAAVEFELEKVEGITGISVETEGYGTGARLVAYFAGEDGETLGTDLKSHAEASLPKQERPASYRYVGTRLPLTVGGKTDRDELQRLGTSIPRAGSSAEFKSNQEAEIAKVWTLLLGVSDGDIRAQSNFFDVGGTSLLAIEASQIISERLGVTIAPRDVYEFPTPEGLAKQAGNAKPQSIERHGREREGRFPLSPAQIGLRYLHVVEQGTDPYVIVDVWTFDDHHSVQQVKSAIRTIVARHEALRTTFPWASEGPFQQVHGWLEPKIDIVEDFDDTDLSRLVTSLAHNTNDLNSGPLVHCWILQNQSVRGLLIAIHHIVCDERSMEVLRIELTKILTNKRVPLPGIQPTDVAKWGIETADERQFAIAEWIADLAGILPVLQLPWDRKRPEMVSSNGASYVLDVPPEVRRRVAAVAREMGTTEFSVLLSAFQRTLHFLSGVNDVVVGVAFGGRNRPEIRDTVGYFVNTLPLRSEITHNESFRTTVRSVHRRMTEVMGRQHVPFDEIVKAINPPRNKSLHPIYQVVFSSGELNAQSDELGDDVGLSKYDLTCTVLSLSDTDDLRLRLEWREQLLARGTAEHWGRILLSVLHTGVFSLDEAPTTTWNLDHELNAVVAGHHTSVAEDPMRVLAEAIDEHGDRVAFEDSSTSLTYDELRDAVTRSAQRLLMTGVSPGATVAVMGVGSVALYSSILGTLAAGCRFVLLDPEAPKDRLEFIISDSGAAALLTDDQSPSVDVGEIPVIQLAKLVGCTRTDEQLDAGYEVQSAPSDDAYICYTSGSTGRPKGVRISRGSLANLAAEHSKGFGLTAADRVLQYSPLTFDASIFEIFTSIAAGATLVAQDPSRRVGPLLEQQLVERHISFVLLPPTVIAQLDPENIHTLETLVTGGEPCPEWLFDRWAKHCRVLNAYGPTEATVCATFGELSQERPTSVGYPVANTGIEIMDCAGQIVARDVVGEIVVTGAGLARGYLNRPHEEHLAFSDTNGKRFYRTGDLGRVHPDGSLDVLGRRDKQVKFHGVRLEVGEVENLASTHPSVDQAVLIKRVRNGIEELLLFCVGSHDMDKTDVRSILRAHLPRAVMPTRIVALSKIPTTGSGKVDRDALAKWKADELTPLAKVSESMTPLMRDLAEIWADMLSGPIPGPDENFFDLGGDSILMVELATRVAPSDPTAALMALYNDQTVRGLARALEEA